MGMSAEELAEIRRARALFDDAMREDDEIKTTGRTPVETLRKAFDLSPQEELPFTGGERPLIGE